MSKPEDKLSESIRVIKTSFSSTLSGGDPKQLKYDIGATPDGSVHVRITGNTGSGSFSDEWISLSDILKTLEKRRKEDPITSYLLDPLFTGRSVNTPAFLLAVLSHEKLVRPLPKKRRLHELGDVRAFTERMDGLASEEKTAKKATKKKVSKKASVKKNASATKKTPVEK